MRTPNPRERRSSHPFVVTSCSQRILARIPIIEFLTHPGSVITDEQLVVWRVAPSQIGEREVIVRERQRVDPQLLFDAGAVEIRIAVDYVEIDVVLRRDATA